MRFTRIIPFLLLLLPALLSGKGRSGTYYIAGTALSANHSVLKNVTLAVKFGKDLKTVAVDSNGHYEITIDWHGACPSGRTFWQRNMDKRKLNPKWVYVTYGNEQIRIRNEWRKYIGSSMDPKAAVTCPKDLYFSAKKQDPRKS